MRDRGEWTRFLEWNDSGDGLSAGTRASVECVLTDANTAAEVTVTAPDRPGLLSDISRAMASTGFNIDKVRLRGSLPPAAKATQRALHGGRPILLAPLRFTPLTPHALHLTNTRPG